MNRPQYIQWFWVVVLLQACAMMVSAANRHVRAGASGNGTDWANAYGNLPATLTRGDTYYVADGTYSSYRFDDDEVGTSSIKIKKAIDSDHGTDAGWSSSYGDGQAVFGSFIFTKGFYEVSGQYEYGFKVDFELGGYGAQINGTNISLGYIDFDGITNTGNFYYTSGVLGVNIGKGTAGFHLHHCAIHGCHTLIQEADGVRNGFDSSGTIVEYCRLYNSRSHYGPQGQDGPHANIYFCSGSQNGLFRYNISDDYNAEGFFFTGWEGSSQNWTLYGNVFFGKGAGEVNPRGIELRPGYSYTNILIYNNTFVSLPVGAVLNRATEDGLNRSVGVEVMNNLAYSSPFILGDSSRVSANILITSNAFLDMLRADFRLASPLQPGAALPPPYNADRNGVTRGTDGSWDVGAYEFVSGSINPLILVSPGNLDFGSVPLGSPLNLSNMTVRNVGGGTLVGLAAVTAPFTIVSGASYSLAHGQSQVVLVGYAPSVAGYNYQKLTFSGGGGVEVQLSGIGDVLVPPPVNDLSFDAVSGTITVPFVYTNDYFYQSSETGVTTGGKAVYFFNLINSGQYVIQATVNAPNDGANSFFLNIDGDPQDPSMIWDIPITTNFEQRVSSWRGSGSSTNGEFVPKVFDLNAGLHQLVIVGREPNVQLQRFRIRNAVEKPSNLRSFGAP
ncbi:MAG: hypothetical protein SH819_11045 [Cytophagales bacterium]|nr:hypothetical protein [Cytophagales bacterium]